MKIRTYLLIVFICFGCVRSAFWNKKHEKMPANFSRDMLYHKKNSLEWWYISGHLEDSNCLNYGFEFAVFNRYIPFWGHRLMLNYSLSKENDSNFYQFVDYVKFKKKNRRDTFLNLGGNSKNHKWSLKQSSDGFEIVFDAAKEQIPSINLRTTALKNPVFQGPEGYMDYGSLKKAGYFSYTRSASKGRLITDGISSSVKGQIWMDRQWNCIKLTQKHVSWSWICLQMDSLNSEVMIFKSENAHTNETIIQGNYIDGTGKTHFLKNGDIMIDTSQIWISPETSRRYPMVWQVKIPSFNLSFTVRPMYEDQEIPVNVKGQDIIVYWEGKCYAWGMFNGLPFSAKAFLEMTNQPEQKP